MLLVVVLDLNSRSRQPRVTLHYGHMVYVVDPYVSKAIAVSFYPTESSIALERKFGSYR